MSERSATIPDGLFEAMLEIQDEVGQGFFVHEGGRPVYASEACARITGYAPEELMALSSVFDLVIPEERDDLAGRMRRRMMGEAVAEFYETAITHKMGRRVDVEVVKPVPPRRERTGAACGSPCYSGTSPGAKKPSGA